jgi:eukaryotic-like serine/threonine-protein kinase
LDFELALLRGDEAAAGRDLDGAVGKQEEPDLYEFLGDDLCRRGKIREARQAFTHGVEAAHARNQDEYRGVVLARKAVCEIDAGFTAEAQQDINAALAVTKNRAVQTGVAYVFARLGNDREVKKYIGELDKEFASDTLLHGIDIPRARGALSLYHGDPAQALRDVEPGAAYELSPYAAEVMAVHAEAYLRSHDGTHAAEEYKKILSHRGVNTPTVLYTLAHLGLARAYGLENKSAEERNEYQLFFADWKDADPDIPLLKQAKAEYAKLQ